MRRILKVTVAALSVMAVSVAAAAMPGVPEIDNANVKIDVKQQPKFVPKSCVGEDGINYVTYRGGWRGSETETIPGSTDYNLTGVLVISNVVWTINLKTLRGVLTGDARLGSVDKPVYSGRGDLTLITQGLPKSPNVVAARGWLDAAAGPADDQQLGGSVLANVELQIQGGSFAASGGFGDLPGLFNTPSYSVATINETC